MDVVEGYQGMLDRFNRKRELHHRAHTLYKNRDMKVFTIPLMAVQLINAILPISIKRLTAISITKRQFLIMRYLNFCMWSFGGQFPFSVTNYCYKLLIQVSTFIYLLII